jgi:hypothetical protein
MEDGCTKSAFASALEQVLRCEYLRAKWSSEPEIKQAGVQQQTVVLHRL